MPILFIFWHTVSPDISSACSVLSLLCSLVLLDLLNIVGLDASQVMYH